MNKGLMGFPKRAGTGYGNPYAEIQNVTPIITTVTAQATSPVMSGLGRWFRADLGVTSSSSRVSAWADQTGSGNNATQATGGNQPLLVASVFDGNPALRFVSSRPDNLSVDLSLLVSSDYTITIVASRSVTGNKHIMGAITSGTNNASLHIGWGSATTFIVNHWNSDITATVPDFVSGAIFAATTVRLSGVGRKIASVGQDLLVSSTSAALTGIQGGGTIGRAIAINFDGDIAEILVYSRALSRAEQIQNECYLRTRYPSLGAFQDF